jgi:restriction system protein
VSTMASDWREYQEEVAAFFRTIGLEANTNVTVQGIRTTHEIDVLVKSSHVGFEVKWFVECKDWSTRVSKVHVLGLRQIVVECGADRGILLCEVGFQSGAIEASHLTNVWVTTLQELQNKASFDVSAMRVREFYDRLESCRMTYWEIPKEDRILKGLRPEVSTIAYSGNVIMEVCGDLLAAVVRGKFPYVSDTSYIPGTNAAGLYYGRIFDSAPEVVKVVDRLLHELEEKLGLLR